MMQVMGFLATPLGYVMDWLYLLVQNYGLTLVLFTVLTKVVMFPLSIKQQKSTAKMAAVQPIMNEVQKKWANDKQRQQEEVMKIQQEYNISMTAGCLPMIAPMFVLFGLIEVIYSPLVHLFHISRGVIEQAVALAGLPSTISVTVQNDLMVKIAQSPDKFIALLGADKVERIANFNFNFFGLDLSAIPTFGFNLTIILPVLSILTMVILQIYTQKTAATQMTGAMKWMPWIMSIMFVTYGFTVPGGFSLYYAISNLLSIIQSFILKKMYDPDKIKAEFAAEIEVKRAEKKKKKQVVVKTETGEETVKDVTEAELARIRLARARELEELKYKD